MASLMNTPMDHIAKATPPRTIAAEKMGNDSMMEKKKSGRLEAIREKSEKSNEKNARKPDC